MKQKIEKDSFIEEIEEDLKNDNIKKLWDKYGVYLIAIMAGVILLTVASETYSYFKTQANQKLVNEYVYGLNLAAGKEFDKSIAIMDNLAQKSAFIKDLALIEKVNILIEENKIAEADALLESIVQNSSVDFTIKDVARIMLATKAVDNKSTQEVEAILQPLLNENNAWYANAQELLAISYLKAGNKEKAKELFATIASEAASETIKNRASDMLAVL